MYGDDEYTSGKRESRPLSFIASPLSEQVEVSSYFETANPNTSRSPTRARISPNGHPAQRGPVSPSHRGFNPGSPSPTRSLRDQSPIDTANQQFPLNDIDYESSPAAVQQEMHNLQALRRMSMDVSIAGDPDLPSLAGASMMPAVAPTGDDNEEDPSRLFWVPARVHPELAPMEFKTFLENRVQTIKRRSGDSSSLSVDGLERSGSMNGGSLRRKKSMLSRQIDNSGGRGAVGYKDGADQIERKRSLNQNQQPEIALADLQELDELIRDPSKAVQKLSLDTNLRDSGVEVQDAEDKPILPTAPGAMGLKRSTHTTYRRGSMRKGERVPYSQRAKQRAQEAGEDDAAASPLSPTDAPLQRVPTDPMANNFSRPGRPRRSQKPEQYSPTSAQFPDNVSDSDAASLRSDAGRRDSEDTLQRAVTRVETPVPRIIETPPPPEEEQPLQYQRQEQEPPRAQQSFNYPVRSSSQSSQQSSVPAEPPARSSRRPPLGRQLSSAVVIPKAVSGQGQTLNQMAQQPSPLMGGNSRTDSLTFIPTLPEEKKTDKKLKKEEAEVPRKTSWGWFKGDRKDKDDEPKKGKKGDNTRLDVLQQSIDQTMARGRESRESIVLERPSMDERLTEERQKQGRTKSGDGKKEKDGIFSSLFGGKKKGERDGNSKKAASLRALSPEVPPRMLKPDIDYSWTRFSLLEERAIYRMAHIKLANPRRALYSQVLLSNFMYSYLAKVQQMHPNVQIPQSAQQKKQQELERRQKEIEAQQAAEQQYKYDYHQVRKSSVLMNGSLTMDRALQTMRTKGKKIAKHKGRIMLTMHKFMITTTKTNCQGRCRTDRIHDRVSEAMSKAQLRTIMGGGRTRRAIIHMEIRWKTTMKCGRSTWKCR